ncbi:MAG: choice-of-anchor Q domain-containing protein [Phycisphaerae bacterium]
MSGVRIGTILGLSVLLAPLAALRAGTYYIAPNGSDSTGDGSLTRPWGSIRYATDHVPDDGSTVLLRDGLYVGTQSLGRTFAKPCTIAAEHPYKALLQSPGNSNRAFYCYSGANAVLQGLNIYGSGSTGSEYVVHISNPATHDITFDNCFIHDSYSNDVVKINSGTHHIAFRNCVLYNPPNPGDSQFDINTVTDITIENNILLNDYPGSGRPAQDQTHPFIVIKNSGDSSPDFTRRITVRGNVFQNWSGLNDQSYLLIGEDGKPFMEAQDVLVENNLFLFNSPDSQVGAFMVKGGARNITFRSNTVVGHPVGGSAFAMRMQKIASNPNMENIYYYNNIWSDPAGGMVDFSDGYKSEVSGDLVLSNNLYWNKGKGIPTDSWSILDPDAPWYDDPRRTSADPLLGNPSGMVISRWLASSGQFLSGQDTIRGEFERLVRLYGALAAGSPAIDKADPAHISFYDILGNPRGAMGDIGAFERNFAIYGDANEDGIVDMTDYTTWFSWFGSSAGVGWRQADFNGDGLVDMKDYVVWFDHFGQVQGASVPEPATLSLLVLGVLAALRKRRG